MQVLHSLCVKEKLLPTIGRGTKLSKVYVNIQNIPRRTFTTLHKKHLHRRLALCKSKR